MIWLNPVAWFALVTTALPVLIHLFIQRRAERFPFPTLRFLQPTRLAAIRRHLLEDLALLAIRIAVLAAAAGALAGPLLVTAARRQAWDRRVVRAIVTDAAARRTDSAAPFQEQTFATAALGDGIRRAIFWLDAAPPARREIVVSSALPIGSITDADVAAIPSGIGVRFERTGTLPSTRTVAAGRLLTSRGTRAREVTFDGDRTAVRDAAAADPIAWPIDIVAPRAQQPAADAAIAAVLSQRVWAGAADRRARLLVQPADVAQDFGRAIDQPWMADAVWRIAGDRDLHDAALRVTAGLADTHFAVTPWQILAIAADGRPLASAAGSPDRLLVASAAPASALATPVLLRAIANAIAAPVDLQRAEVTPIADAALQRWSRPAAPVSSPRVESVDQDDRRWLWLAALLLMALETWVRRSRIADQVREGRQEDARVA
jgi:hypothetical protein